jgi:hypothetical protein
MELISTGPPSKGERLFKIKWEDEEGVQTCSEAWRKIPTMTRQEFLTKSKPDYKILSEAWGNTQVNVISTPTGTAELPIIQPITKERMQKSEGAFPRVLLLVGRYPKFKADPVRPLFQELAERSPQLKAYKYSADHQQINVNGVNPPEEAYDMAEVLSNKSEVANISQWSRPGGFGESQSGMIIYTAEKMTEQWWAELRDAVHTLVLHKYEVLGMQGCLAQGEDGPYLPIENVQIFETDGKKFVATCRTADVKQRVLSEHTIPGRIAAEEFCAQVLHGGLSIRSESDPPGQGGWVDQMPIGCRSDRRPIGDSADRIGEATKPIGNSERPHVPIGSTNSRSVNYRSDRQI